MKCNQTPINFLLVLLLICTSSCNNKTDKQAATEHKYMSSLRLSDSLLSLLSLEHYQKIQSEQKYLHHGTVAYAVKQKADRLKELTAKSIMEVHAVKANDSIHSRLGKIKKNYYSETRKIDSGFARIPLLNELLSNENVNHDFEIPETKNQVLKVEAALLNNLSQRIGRISEHYTVLRILIGQNKTYFSSGEELEIAAGIGSYSTAANPSVLISGQEVKMEQGAGVYRLKVSGAGKKSIPVRIIYDRPEGARDTVDKDVEYYVE